MVRLRLVGAPTIIGTVDTPGNAIDVAMQGNLACIADQDGGLQVIDVTDPTAPQILGDLPTSGPCNHVIMSNGMAYATTAGAFYAVDLADPAHPLVVKTIRVDGTLHELANWGNNVYIAGDQPELSVWMNGAIHIITLGSDFWLTPLGNIETSGWASDVAVAGAYSYVADWSAGLTVIDCSDPADPQLIATEDTPGSARGVVISGTHAYVADGECGLQVIDVANPQNPVIVGSIDTQGTANRIVVSGTRAFIADGLRGLRIFDVSDPANPTALPGVETPGDACGVAVSGNRAYVADYAAGLQIIDIADPQNPHIVTNVPVAHALSKYMGVTVSGRYACVADADHAMWLVDTEAPNQPVIGVEIGGPGRDVSVQGNRAYIAAGSGGLQVVDISDPESPVVVGAGLTPGFAAGIAVLGGHAFIADDGEGLQVLELTRPANPQLVGSVDTPGRAKKVFVAGPTAYVADGTGGLQIIDVSDPEYPTPLGSALFNGDAADVLVDGVWAYVADREEYLRVVNVSNPQDPLVYSYFRSGTEPSGLASSGRSLFVAAGGAGLQIYDIADPRVPEWWGEAGSEEALAVVAKEGDTYSCAYVADRVDGLEVFDVSDPEQPHRESYSDALSCGACGVVCRGSLLTVTGPFGVRIYNVGETGIPSFLFGSALPSPAYSAVIEGEDHHVYIADGSGGLQIYDKVNGPGMLGGIDTPGLACGVAVQGDYVYVAADSSGLLVVPAQCSWITALRDPEPAISGMNGLRIIPNPSSSGTSVSWNLMRAGVVQGAVVDVNGRRVRSLIDATLPPGSHQLIWDGRDENQRRVASGVYWVHLQTKGGSGVARVVLLR